MTDGSVARQSATAPATGEATPRLEAQGVTKYFGRVIALQDVSIAVHEAEVVCLLGDNGAGKSTLIKILSGLWSPDQGTVVMDGEPVNFRTPKDAMARGIATVYQDLAVLPLMSIARNFVLGNEPTVGRGVLRRFDHRAAERIARNQMERIGITVRDTTQMVGTLSGGERQTVAIARAEYYGARVLILDEPTSALGVKEAAIVLRHVLAARERGMGVILITHNVQHALPVGDRFVILAHGRQVGTFHHDEIDEMTLHRLMGGGEELHLLRQDLETARARRSETSSNQVSGDH